MNRKLYEYKFYEKNTYLGSHTYAYSEKELHNENWSFRKIVTDKFKELSNKYKDKMLLICTVFGENVIKARLDKQCIYVGRVEIDEIKEMEK